MTRLSKLIMTFTLLALSTGCVSMRAEDCHAVNWFERGEQAGRSGLPISEVLRQQNGCSAYGVVPNRSEIAQGWRAGLNS
jgi:hypothetical protein